MLSIAEMQRWATVVRDYAATAVVLLAASIITAAFALARRRAAARRWRRHTGGYSNNEIRRSVTRRHVTLAEIGPFSPDRRRVTRGNHLPPATRRIDVSSRTGIVQ